MQGHFNFSVETKAVLIAQGHLIRNAAGRKDLHLIVDSRLADRSLTFTRSRQWEDTTVYWTGAVNKGKHSVYMRSPQANTWGCQDQWGDLDTTVIPSSTGVVAYQTPDKRRGCPPSAKANSPLISKTFTVGKTSLAIIQGHMIRTPRTFHLSTPLLPQRAPPYFSRIAPTLFTPEAPATSFGKLQLLWCTALTKHCGKRLQAVVEACFAHPPPPRPVYS